MTSLPGQDRSATHTTQSTHNPHDTHAAQTARPLRTATSEIAKLKAIMIWLKALCFCVLTIVVIGGITRLTGSGLSMVDWKLVGGILPPLTHSDWMKVYQAYQASPEGQLINAHMDLAAFKKIFFWEYFHRIFARGIGFVFLLPWLYFLARGFIQGRMIGLTAIAFILGGCQGLLGWYMVKSGLVDVPQVSHLRLAAHLGLALFILSYLWWLSMTIKSRIEQLQHGRDEPIKATRNTSFGLKPMMYTYLALLVAQIAYGAFTAGLKAGYGYNTFPTMLGYWLPPGLVGPSGLLHALIYNPMMVQFVHRGLGWLLLGFATFMAAQVWANHDLDRSIRRAVLRVAALTWVQFALGVATLLLVVPISLAVIHQFTATLLLLSTLSATYSVHRWRHRHQQTASFVDRPSNISYDQRPEIMNV